jgi:hypothetical protein
LNSENPRPNNNRQQIKISIILLILLKFKLIFWGIYFIKGRFLKKIKGKEFENSKYFLFL